MAGERSAAQDYLSRADRLQRDLEQPTPVFYRQVPGNRQLYYNPRDKSYTVTEHYVVRVYRPRLDEIRRQQIKKISAKQVVIDRINTSNLLDTWLVKQAAQGDVLPRKKRNLFGTTVTVLVDKEKQAEFNDLVERLKTEAFIARTWPLDDPGGKEVHTGPNSEYARLLVELGRRRPDEPFGVGDSPKRVGGRSYIDTYVIPSLRGQPVPLHRPVGP